MESKPESHEAPSSGKTMGEESKPAVLLEGKTSEESSELKAKDPALAATEDAPDPDEDDLDDLDGNMLATSQTCSS
jgi:hypothetical protein